MTPTHVLLGLATLSTAGLLGFALVLATAAAVGVFRRPRQVKVAGPGATTPVAIWVPCHREGEGAARCVETLLAQDYAGPLEIHALLSPDDDETEAALRRLDLPQGRHLKLTVGPARFKSDKLNRAATQTSAPLVGILDADHRASPDWIRASVAALDENHADAVQARRRPLAVRTWPQLMDSAQAHAGNELLNAARAALGQPVFFTGTGAVFRRDRLGEEPFGGSVTEDTELSYALLTNGSHIAYLPGTGSAEEVAPDLLSFVNRRRRWACGHTGAFLARWPLRPASGWRRFHLALHGAFYLVPGLALLALWSMALFTWPQLDAAAQAFSVLTTLALAVPVGLLFGARLPLQEVGVAAVWIFPQILLGLPLLLRLVESERYWLLSQFPGAFVFLILNAALLAIPLLILVVATWIERPFSRVHLARIVLGYPFFLMLELVAVSLGWIDLLAGRQRWPSIRRTLEEHSEQEQRQGRKARLGLGAIIGLSLALGGVLVHDLTLTSGCAGAEEARPPWWLKDQRSQMALEVRRQPEGAQLRVTGLLTLLRSDGNPAAWKVTHLLDEEMIGEGTLRDPGQRSARQKDVPLGFEARRWRSIAQRGDLTCTFERVFTTTTREQKGRTLHLNGEPFLIKGIIPSFAVGRAAEDVAEGLEQLKSLGTNAVRYYHPVSDDTAAVAQDAGLMLIVQPRSSTWGEVDLRDAADRRRLVSRFAQELERDAERPGSLLVTLGNELELQDPAGLVPPLSALTHQLRQAHPGRLWAYSTFFLFVDYEAPVLGVNMLDSGQTYWRAGLRVLRDRGGPFYASELGAFVAFTERPPEVLRAARLVAQWQALLRADAWGGVLFQSHDHWAQPVPTGLNDPFLAEQPDDRRGLYSRDGEPTSLVEVVRQLFADVDSRWIDADHLELTNRRPFALRGLRLEVEERAATGSGQEASTAAVLEDELAPGATLRLEGPVLQSALRASQARRGVAETDGDPGPRLWVHYTTHRGLPGRSAVVVPGARQAALLRGPALIRRNDEQSLIVETYAAGTLDVWVPSSWEGARIDGQLVDVGRVHRLGAPPVEVALATEIASRVSPAFRPLAEGSSPKGPLRYRFRLPAAKEGWILLGGLGADRVTHLCASPSERKTHTYRELVLERRGLVGDDGWCELRFDRKETRFLAAAQSPRGEDVPITLSVARAFQPRTVVVERVSNPRRP